MNIQRNDIVFIKSGSYSPEGSVMHLNHYAIVLQNDIGNQCSPTIIVAFLTSKLKRMDMPTHVVIQHYEGLYRTSMFQAEQIATVPKDSIVNVVDHLREEDITRINMAIHTSLALGEAS